MSAELAESFGVPGGKGVLVTEVIDDGPAARAGLKPGDVVLSYESEPVVESYRLRWLTANSAPGTKVRMGVWRGGEARQVTLALESDPGPSSQPASPPQPTAS